MTGSDTSIAVEQLEAHRIDLDDQGYDDNGCYWGVGQPLYWVVTPDGKRDVHVRADDATRARQLAAEEIPLRQWERDQAESERSTPVSVEPEHGPDGTYGYSNDPQMNPASPSTEKRNTGLPQPESAPDPADGARQASPARLAGKAGGSGPSGQAGPT